MDTLPIRRARPIAIRAAVAALVAITGLVLATKFGQLEQVGHGPNKDVATTTERLLAICGAVVLLGAGIYAVRSAASAAKVALQDADDAARGTPVSFVISIVGYIIILLCLLAALHQPLTGLLLGGALTGVVIGIAAQQTLGNFFAGIVLLVVRPFTIGERVFLRSTVGEYEGVITNMSMFYVTIVVERGPVSLPNSAVLASAIGPGARSDAST
ncbi:MAG: mechanosensitive ion channel family protein [Actinomycetota bacterium]|nr:mechanosensitive ion channel family protein [Actinomycetota bacterium]